MTYLSVGYTALTMLYSLLIFSTNNLKHFTSSDNALIRFCCQAMDIIVDDIGVSYKTLMVCVFLLWMFVGTVFFMLTFPFKKIYIFLNNFGCLSLQSFQSIYFLFTYCGGVLFVALISKFAKYD